MRLAACFTNTTTATISHTQSERDCVPFYYNVSRIIWAECFVKLEIEGWGCCLRAPLSHSRDIDQPKI